MVDPHASTEKKCKLEGDGMILPRVPYNISKSKLQIAAFAGLNRTENTSDGELTDAYGLTTDHYPALSPHSGDIFVQDGTTDIFEWGGSLVQIRNSVLYLNDTPLCNITAREMQYAVVNTKLIIVPENICIDMESGTYKKLYATAMTPAVSGAYSFTASGITASLDPKIRRVDEYVTAKNILYAKSAQAYDTNPSIYTYGNDAEAVKACYSNGQWDLEALEALKATFACGDIPKIAVGDIIIPSFDPSDYGGVYKPVCGDASTNTVPNKSAQNAEGYYAVITALSYYEAQTIGEHVLYTKTYISFEVYNAMQTSLPFSSVFSPGDFVSVSGCLPPFNIEAAKITDIDDASNTLLFEDESFPFSSSSVLYKTNVDITSSAVVIQNNGGTIKRKANKLPLVSDATIIYSSDTKKLYIYHSSGEKAAELDTVETSSEKDFILSDFSAYTANVLSIKRVMPPLDYICSHDNRLFGVSNKDKTIYVSALGLPTIFCDYTGDAGSYSVAVGSNGDFTAMCAYGGGVLCFKENSVVKVFGSMPSDFYTNEYTITGVQSGSCRSLQIINETLYYKGVFGVYAYTGGIPSLISGKLGDDIMTDAVAGSDSMHYYIDMTDQNGNAALYVYDLRHGLWTIDRKVSADAFATVGGKLMMASGGCLYTLNTGGEIKHKWLAEFAPFDETAHEKKVYTTLRLCLEMQKGSKIKVDIRENGEPWKTVFTHGASRALTLNLPIRVGRCDRMQIRLRGQGGVTVRSMVRELFAGSEV